MPDEQGVVDALLRQIDRARADLALMEKRAISAELAAANWKWIYKRTHEDLDACRSSWSTCQRLKCCSCLMPPCDEASNA